MKQFYALADIVLVALMAVTAPATAQTSAEKLAFCDNAGDLAEATVAARDAGIPVEQAQAMGDGISMDSNAKAMFSALISLTYVMDGVEGPLMKQVAIQMCQKSMGLK